MLQFFQMDRALWLAGKALFLILLFKCRFENHRFSFDLHCEGRVSTISVASNSTASLLTYQLQQPYLHVNMPLLWKLANWHHDEARCSSVKFLWRKNQSLLTATSLSNIIYHKISFYLFFGWKRKVTKIGINQLHRLKRVALKPLRHWVDI